jgi:hypothetical protein
VILGSHAEKVKGRFHHLKSSSEFSLFPKQHRCGLPRPGHNARHRDAEPCLPLSRQQVKPGRLYLPPQICRQHRLEKLPVVPHMEVEQFLDEQALSKLGVLAHQPTAHL